MKFIVMSDTHGNTSYAEKLIKKYKNNIKKVIHLGDVVKDALYLKNRFNDIEFEIVRGNNDWTSDFPAEKVIEVDNKKILLTHGHMYGVKHDYGLLVNHAKLLRVDACLFGHTHLQEEFYVDGKLFLNPGSLLLSRDGESRYAIIEITEWGVVGYLEKV